MVILVSSQGRPTREGLLTVGIRALVWAFSRMYASMSREGAGIAERLQMF
jgi:hypothetical protein